MLHVLVTNDDGIGAEGIDALVEGLRALPDTQVTVVAPAENQSGSGGKFTPGSLKATDSTTESGFAGRAVAGFPADSMIWAVEQSGLPDPPDLVISGINEGANIGPLVEISGTIGAARRAVANGIPALATSQGFGEEIDYGPGLKFTLDWVAEHRDDLIAGNAPVKLFSINTPTCPSGRVRGLVSVPTAADATGRDLTKSDCESTVTSPADDVDGFANGFATLSEVDTESS